MGFILKIFLVSLTLILVILFAPGIPPHIKFEFNTLEPPLPLEGKLSPNSILDKAELVKADKLIVGPESVVQRGDEIYTGTIGGELVRIKNGKVTTIARIGKQCDGAWDIKNCGRIAGLRFGPDKKLIAADVAYGILKIDVDTGDVETLVSMDKPIDGKVPMFPDDIDVAKDGIIYWSDASTNVDVDGLIIEALGEPSGRLVKFDPKTKKNTVLINKLHFANGVELSRNEDFVLVSETMKARVMRYYLKGEKKGQTDVFVDRLPGLPDNVRSNGKDGFYIVLAAPRIPSEQSLVDDLGPLPLLRKFIVRVHYLITNGLKSIESLYPGPVFREWIVYVSNFGPLGDLEKLPYKAIIVETDKDGNIIGSLQNERGPVTGLSQMSVEKDFAYLGSPAQKGLYRLKKEFLERR